MADRTGRLRRWLTSPLTPWVLAVVVLHFLLVIEVPTDFLAADLDALQGSPYASLLEVTGSLGLPRRMFEAAAHELACLALLAALLHARVRAGAAVLAFALATLSPAVLGDLLRRVHPSLLSMSLDVAAAASVVAAITASAKRRWWLFAIAITLRLLATWIAAPAIPDEDLAVPLTLEAPWLACSPRTPVCDTSPAGRDRIESLIAEPLMRDRVRLPDAAVFIEAWRQLLSAALWGLLALGVIGTARTPTRAAGVVATWALFVWLTGGSATLSATVLLPAAAAVGCHGLTQRSWPRAARVVGSVLLVAIVGPNFVDLPNSAFVGTRILPSDDQTYLVDTQGREHFVGTRDRDLQLHFPRPLLGRKILIDVEVPGRGTRDIVVTLRSGQVTIRRVLDTATSPIRIEVPPTLGAPGGAPGVATVTVEDAADPTRLVWKRLRIE